ncbi:MAG: hypothetical protein B7O98_08885 [Zestosphaera tikiterensis]|uniref:Uncharacterized protein n=1 Tax=Zestosphaera tikiterensis TaxID=1973259 RepID=A0A2R7Y2C6_9CREN|nr:MAG: hypothetical protein B7O98_08715 [Zestosphaera tikiterensis]PUA31728.1 MAG: hypothetical protein B7O98_08885 [Zestosphaera tikiterensis]
MNGDNTKWLKKNSTKREDPTPTNNANGDIDAVNPHDRVSQQKLEYFMGLANDAINGGRHILILVENLLNHTEMNKILEPTYIIMAVALTNSEHSDASHLLTNLGPGLYVVTKPLVFRPMEGYEFAEILNLLKSGKHIDDRTNEILVLYPIHEPRKDVDYAIFAVGSDEYIDTAVNLIEHILGRAKAIFKARFDDVNEVYCVLLLPLAESEIEEGLLRLSATSQEVKSDETS